MQEIKLLNQKQNALQKRHDANKNDATEIWKIIDSRSVDIQSTEFKKRVRSCQQETNLIGIENKKLMQEVEKSLKKIS